MAKFSRKSTWEAHGVAISIVIFAAGLGVGWAGAHFFGQQNPLAPSDQTVRETGRYALVSPLLLCGNDVNGGTLQQYKPLKTTLQNIIDAAEKDGSATDVSVYFRGGQNIWLGINENDSYAAASLLKVPLMIAYLKEAETTPGSMSRTLTYDGTADLNAAETFKPAHPLKPGTYTIDQLMTAMIVDSDNNALNLLFDNIDQKTLVDVFTDLGLSVPGNNPANVTDISAKQYSYFFRILTNATYLTPEDSEKALELLTQSDFEYGLRAGTPANTTIADKFGERTVFTQTGSVVERDLHDCGIVYDPAQHYLLCVMTRGTDYTKLEGIIQSIAQAVYTEENTAK